MLAVSGHLRKRLYLTVRPRSSGLSDLGNPAEIPHNM